MSVRAVKQIAQGDPAEQDLNLISLGTGSVLLTQYRSRPTPRLQNSGSHSIVQVTAVTAAPGKCQKCSFSGPTPHLCNLKPWDWSPRNFGWIKTLGGDSSAHSSLGILCSPPSPLPPPHLQPTGVFSYAQHPPGGSVRTAGFQG